MDPTSLAASGNRRRQRSKCVSEGNVRSSNPTGRKASSLRSQKSSAKHSGIFWPPTSLRCKFQQLRGYSNSLPVAYPILLFLAVLTRTTFFPSPSSLAHHTNLFLSLSSAIRSHLISLFCLFCRAPPLGDHGGRDRGRAGQGAEVPATDDGRVPRPDERDQDEEGRQPPPADARVLQVTTKVSESVVSISTACSNLVSSIEWNPCRRFAL